MWKKGNTYALLVGMPTGTATLENCMEVLQKVKNRTTLRPSNCTTRYLSKGHKNVDSKGHVHPSTYSSTIDNSQIMERAQMSTDWWIGKEDIYIHTHILYVQYICIYRCVYTCMCVCIMEYYSVIKKNEVLPFATTWMELECIRLSEISQRKTNIIWFHPYVKFKKHNMNIGEGKEK